VAQDQKKAPVKKAVAQVQKKAPVKKAVVQVQKKAPVNKGLVKPAQAAPKVTTVKSAAKAKKVEPKKTLPPASKS
jgi:hypothetical protein